MKNIFYAIFLLLFVVACGTVQGVGYAGYSWNCVSQEGTDESLCHGEDPSGNFIDLLVPNDGVSGFLKDRNIRERYIRARK